MHSTLGHNAVYKHSAQSRFASQVLLAPSKYVLVLVWQRSVVGNVDPAATASSSSAKNSLIVFYFQNVGLSTNMHPPAPVFRHASCYEAAVMYMRWCLC